LVEGVGVGVVLDGGVEDGECFVGLLGGEFGGEGAVRVEGLYSGGFAVGSTHSYSQSWARVPWYCWTARRSAATRAGRSGAVLAAVIAACIFHRSTSTRSGSSS
jgi:hypothetical protein